MGSSGSSGCQGWRGRQRSRGIAIHKTGVGGGEGRESGAIYLGLVVGGDCQRRCSNRQTSGDVGDCVVRDSGSGSGDGIGVSGDMGSSGSSGCQGWRGRQRSRGIAIHKAGVGGSEGRQSGPVNLCLAIRGNCQRCRQHGESSVGCRRLVVVSILNLEYVDCAVTRAHERQRTVNLIHRANIHRSGGIDVLSYTAAA